MAIKHTSILVAPILACLFLYIPGATATDLYFIDAHSQADEGIDKNELIQRMDAAGISKTILSSRRHRRAFDMADWAEAHPDRLIASVRVKSKHYVKNTRKFYKKINKQVRSDRFNAMSEVLLFHAQKGNLASEVIVYPDDRRVAVVLDAASSKGWPLVIHIEFGALYGGMRQEFYDKIQNLLSANPQQAFCLIHMGQLKTTEVADLLSQHNNLYFLTSHSNPLAVQRSNQPWVNMFQGKKLAPDWKLLITKHPDRFIFALDNVWAEHWRNGYTQQVELWRKALHALPKDVAQAVAHGNAERLWQIAN